MATALEDLRILKAAEEVADLLWKKVVGWDEFAKDVVGKQIARAVDSIGANIAESYGRFNYGEKLQFLYYSRGSLFETKYWMNRALVRGLLHSEEVKDYTTRLSDVARQLNTFANGLKSLRQENKDAAKSIREGSTEYVVEAVLDDSTALFTEAEFRWLES